MGSFDFLPDWFPQMAKMVPNAGLLQDDNSRDAMRTAGLLSMANAFVNPQVAPGAQPSIMQTITGGLNGFVQGANAAAPQIYDAQNKAAMDSFVKNNPDVGQKFGLPAGFPMNGNLVSELAKHYATNRATLNGGATGALIDRAQHDPNFMRTYQLMNGGGLRNGLMMDESGNMVPIPGYGAAQGVNEFGKESGKQRAELGYAAPKAQATEAGKEMGNATGNLALQQAQLPTLEAAVNKLDELGRKATYTMAGQARDYVARQLGADVPDSAVARAEYISTVDNVILPTLRATFGAQFTQKEGETLRATLGNPDLSPPEKTAVLRSYIAQKKANVASLQRQVDNGVPNAFTPAPPSEPDIAAQAQNLKNGAQGITGIEKPGNGFMTTPKGTKYRVVQ